MKSKTLRQRYIAAWIKSYEPMVKSGKVTQRNVNINIDGFGSWTTARIIEHSRRLGIEPVDE